MEMVAKATVKLQLYKSFSFYNFVMQYFSNGQIFIKNIFHYYLSMEK